jgi:hypothetical protein
MAQENERLPRLEIRTGWVELTVTCEPFVVMTFKGYAPAVHVRVIQTGLDYLLYISAKSLAEGLEPMRKNNGGRFSGLRFQVRKASEDKFAKYELRQP